jgi:fused-like protein
MSTHISETVGNAAFHSSELYPLLADCVEPLCSALRDPDDKTRANVAGAIGNLIRNGAQLCPLMVEQGVVELLLRLLVEDPDVGPKVRKKSVFDDCCGLE